MVADGAFCRLSPIKFKSTPLPMVKRATIPDFAYSEAVTNQGRKHNAWTIVTVSVALLALLLVLVPHPQLFAVALVCPVLAILFLFGIVHVSYWLWRPSETGEDHSPQSPDLSFRFQRPPPATI
jgi:protein-S-isoprenylcysteine O-methyltransferase Ste14